MQDPVPNEEAANREDAPENQNRNNNVDPEVVLNEEQQRQRDIDEAEIARVAQAAVQRRAQALREQERLEDEAKRPQDPYRDLVWHPRRQTEERAAQLPNFDVGANLDQAESWDLINDDRTADIMITRRMLAKTVIVAEQVVQVWDESAVIGLCARRVPNALFNARYPMNRAEALALWLEFVASLKVIAAAQQKAYKNAQTLGVLVKAMSGLDKSVSCKPFFGSVSRFVKLVEDFRTAHGISKEILYTHLTTVTRMTPAMLAVWQATDANVNHRTYDGLRIWLYRHYVKEK